MTFGKTLIIVGIVLVAIGIFAAYGPRIPFLGRLPGDIYIKRDNFTFYFPLATCILISLVVTILLRFFGKK